MITLIIKKEDGSPYWIEHFNSQHDCNQWLEAEKTRPYWDNSYVCTMTDDSPSAEEIAIKKASQAADLADLDQTRKILKGIKKADLVASPDAMATAIMKIIKFLRADQ